MTIRKRKRQKRVELSAVSLHDPAVNLDALIKREEDGLPAYSKRPWDYKDLPLNDGETPTTFHFRTLGSDEIDDIDVHVVQRTNYGADNILLQRHELRRLIAFEIGLTRVENWDADTPEIDLVEEASRMEEIREALDSSIRKEIGGYILNASEEVEDALGKSSSPESSSTPGS